MPNIPNRPADESRRSAVFYQICGDFSMAATGWKTFDDFLSFASCHSSCFARALSSPAMVCLSAPDFPSLRGYIAGWTAIKSAILQNRCGGAIAALAVKPAGVAAFAALIGRTAREPQRPVRFDIFALPKGGNFTRIMSGGPRCEGG
jgi:hypothetical protein